MISNTRIVLTPEEPWLGLASYQQEHEAYFFGRDRELGDLYERVKRHRLTVLFGPSGFGKTSLLQAGLIPKLLKDGVGWLPVRVRLTFPENKEAAVEAEPSALLKQVLQHLADALEAAGHPSGARLRDAIQCDDPGLLPTLWELWHDTTWGLREEGAPRPVLLFDQFEEVFTLGEDEARARSAAGVLRDVLADLIEDRPSPALDRRLSEDAALAERFDFSSDPARVMIVLREEYLARLERWKQAMPSLLRNRLELRLLDGPRAREAVLGPARMGCASGNVELVAEGTAEAIVRAVAGCESETPLEEIEAVPPYLSLLCAELNKRRLAAKPATLLQISEEMVQKGHREILLDFYKGCFEGMPEAVRPALEDVLLSPGGYRESPGYDTLVSVLKERGVADGAAVLATLQDQHRLIVVEERGGRRRVELTHDVLAPIMKQSRDGRQLREAAARRRRERLRLMRLGATALGVLLLLGVTALAWVAIKERSEAREAAQRARNSELKAVHSEVQAQEALRGATRQLERATLEEGRAWLERARTAEAQRNPFLATLLSGRAVGFRDYGWKSGDESAFGKVYAPLLSQPIRFDDVLEDGRLVETGNVRKLVENLSPTCLPIWCSPVSAHHGDAVSNVAFSPDGTRLATGSRDHTVKLWEVATGKEVASLAGHSDRVMSVAFSPDGTRLATGSWDQTVKLWEVATGKAVASLAGHSGVVYSVAFSPDGTRLATGSEDQTVKLWDLATGKEVASLAGHSGGVSSVAFSPDGTRLATGSDDQTVKLWEVATGKEVASLAGHSGVVYSVAFSPDGTRLATGSNDWTVKLWEVATGKEVASLAGHSDRVSSVAFSPDGTRLTTGSWDQTVKLWEVATGKEVASLAGHSDRVSSVAFSPDGTRLATGSWDQTVKLWEVATGKEVASLAGHGGAVYSVAFSPDGTCLATGSGDQTVKLWDLATGKEVASLAGHGGAVYSVAFSPDGTRLATGSRDQTVKVWEVATGKEVASLAGHSGGVSSVAFSPDGTRLATGSYDQTVKVWEVGTGKEVASLAGHSEAVNSVAFSPDGARLATGSWDKTVKVWEVATGKEVASLAGHSEAVKSVAFSPDGTRLATGSDDKTVKLWEVATGKAVASLAGHSGAVKSVAFSPDGTRLATGSDDKTVKLWEVATGKEVASLAVHSSGVSSVAFSPDGTRLATGSYDQTVKLWDLATGKEAASLAGHSSGVSSMALSPDGTRLATGSNDRMVKLWDWAMGKEVASLAGHGGDVMSVAFSPDGTRLATGSYDQTVKLWEVATGKEVASVAGHSGAVNSVAFSPDGTRLATGSWDQTVKLWEVATGKEVASLAGHSDRVISVAFSPDGMRLATGSSDQTVKLWEVATGKEVASLAGHSDRVMSVAFSPDGTRLATGSDDKTAKLWDLATGKEVASLAGHSDRVMSVAFSPDGTRLATGSSDKTAKLWDLATGKEEASLAGHSDRVMSVAFSPDGTRLATGSDDQTVKLWEVAAGKEMARSRVDAGGPPAMSSSPDLMHFQREGLFHLIGREVVWDTNPSLYQSLVFTPLHYRKDEVFELSQPQIAKVQSVHLHLRLLAKGSQWRAAVVFWNSLDHPNPELRESYLTFLLVQARQQIVGRKGAGLRDLLAELRQQLRVEDCMGSSVTLPLVSFLGAFSEEGRVDNQVDPAKALQDSIWGKGPEAERAGALAQFTAALAPESSYLQRVLVEVLSTSDPAWREAQSKLLASPEAVAGDFTDVAYKDSRDGSDAALVKDVLERARKKFPNDETVPRMAGWCHINLREPAEALASFRQAESLIGTGASQPDVDLLAGLTISRWLTGDKPGAVTDYQRLIAAGRALRKTQEWTDPATIKSMNWPEAESKPMLEALEETLRLHPELKPRDKAGE